MAAPRRRPPSPLPRCWPEPPRSSPGGLASVSVVHTGGYPLVGVLTVLVMPLCTTLLHIVLVQTDR